MYKSELFFGIIALASLFLPYLILKHEANGIKVVAYNPMEGAGFWWVKENKWDYKEGGSEIRVKQGENVTIKLTSIDVYHTFNLSAYGIYEDVYPGKITTINFIADKAGEFEFNCGVFCGVGHAEMVGKLIVEEAR